MDPRNENQGRGPVPAQVDGAGIVYAVIGGFMAWMGLIGLAHAVARWFA